MTWTAETDGLETVVASVVIPARNAAADIADQLRALNEQIDAPPFEVIVADNGSSDDTVTKVHAFQANYPLRVVDASDAPGASHARNRGAVEATSEWLLFCDADDIVTPHWVAHMYDALTSQPDVVVAGNLDLSRNPPAVVRAYGGTGEPIDPASDVLVTTPEPFAAYLPSVCSANFAMNRRAYLAAGGMDESYSGGCEETDFSWRLQEGGLTLVFCPGSVVHYRLRSNARAIFRQQRNYQRERVLLWTRFSSAGMSGPSLRVSLVEFVKHIVPALIVRGDARLGRAWHAGGHFGALEGMVKFRFLNRAPDRRLAFGVGTEATVGPRINRSQR